MKLDARSIPRFLRDPGACRVVLLFGDDAGLIREHGNALTRAVAGNLDDPFRVVELAREHAAQVVAEAATLPLTGGRRVVRLRDATEAALPVATAILAGNASGLVILEAPAIASRSRLRSFLESAPDGAAIGCYPAQGSALATTIRTGFAACDVTADPDAIDWLTSLLGADHALTRQEIERIALAAGPGGVVSLELAMEAADLAGLSVDDAWFAATAGDVELADRALGVALGEGATAVGVLRAGIGHLQRLHRSSLMIADGTNPIEAARAARPPVFFRQQPAFVRALRSLSARRLTAAQDLLFAAELSCKRTGSPADMICRHAVAQLAQIAASKQGGRLG